MENTFSKIHIEKLYLIYVFVELSILFPQWEHYVKSTDFNVAKLIYEEKEAEGARDKQPQG